VDLVTAFGEIKTALLTLTDFTTVRTVLKHPEVWLEQKTKGDTTVIFPLLSFSFAQESPGYQDSNVLWSVPREPIAKLSVHLIVTVSADSLELEMLRLLKKIEDKIVALTQTAEFLVCVTNVDSVDALNGQWKWAIVDLAVGSYKT
jgi:hypothetical protein